MTRLSEPPTLSEQLCELRLRQAPFDVVSIKNNASMVREVWIEPWGASIFLLPGATYRLICEGIERTDGRPGIEVEWGGSLTLWPNGIRHNWLFHENGHLVWDDARPSAVIEVLTSNPVRNKIVGLLQSTFEGENSGQSIAHSVPHPGKRPTPKAEQLPEYVDQLLVEQGLAESIEGARLRLTPGGWDFFYKLLPDHEQ